jgi:peptide/nickel transport system substrate-binding protein
VNGVSTDVQGWIDDPTGDMMSGTYSSKVWLAS